MIGMVIVNSFLIGLICGMMLMYLYLMVGPHD
jgi:hypothetical protein